jgi:hypothetical protein
LKKKSNLFIFYFSFSHTQTNKMETKKKLNSQYSTTKLLRETFEAQKWSRYLEKDYTKKPYVKKIIFFFPDKFQTTTFLKKEEYNQWRELLINELYKEK